MTCTNVQGGPFRGYLDGCVSARAGAVQTGASSFSESPVLVATEADDITADMGITELNRRDVPVVRFNPADIGENLAVSARFAPARGAGRTGPVVPDR
jgi:hypothetical protein